MTGRNSEGKLQMATAAAAAKSKGPKDINFQWVGKDKAGKAVRGDIRSTLR